MAKGGVVENKTPFGVKYHPHIRIALETEPTKNALGEPILIEGLGEGLFV